MENYTNEELLVVQEELIAIRDAYKPTMPWDAPTANTFYITSTWNQRHQDQLLDGPEVYQILAFDPNEEEYPTVETGEEVTPSEVE